MRERRWQSWCHRLIKPECRLSLQINRNADGCNTRLPGVSFNFASCAACTRLPALGVGGILPCSPSSRGTSKQLVSPGREGRQESSKSSHRTHAGVFLPLAFGLCPRAACGCFCLHVHCGCSALARHRAPSCPGLGHCGFRPLSPTLLFRIRFYATGSAVIFF